MKHQAFRSPAANPKKYRGGTLLGLFIGLIVGVLIAAGIVWYLHRTPLPFQNKEARAPEQKADSGTAPAGQAANATAPQSLPGRPGEKQRFEFYKILPSGQDASPAPAEPKKTNGAAASTPAAADTAAAASSETLYLQIGAYQRAADADNVKAKLALLGVEANVQQVKTPDKGVLYRVRTSSFSKAEEMNRVRNQLSQNGIQASVVKIKNAN